MLELLDVHTYYGDSHILHGISLKVSAGSVVALLGRNGMGKSTMVSSIIGFTPPRSGVIRFMGEEIQNLPSHRISRMGLALVPQGRRIFPSLTVEENLLLGCRGKDWTLKKVYAVFPRLKERARNKGNNLSGGEQQMLCIGRALLTNPRLLLLDEPSEGLSPLFVKELGKVLRELKKDGLSMLLVEQNLSLALRMSDYVYLLTNGKVAYECAAQELRSNREMIARHLAVTG